MELHQKRALEDFSKAIALTLTSANAFIGRGVLWDRVKRPEQAIADFSKAIELNPNMEIAYDLRAWVKYKYGKAQAGLADADRAVELGGGARALEVRGHIYQSLNQLQEAIADLRKAIALDPNRRMAKALLEWIEASELPSIKGTCTSETYVEPAYERLEVNVDRGQSRIGEPIILNWAIPKTRQDVTRPAYLVMILPDAVRLEGKGFYGLLGNAPGPFGIKYGAGRVRAVAPLHTKFAKSSGRINLLPYKAGPLFIEWAIVGKDGCGEWISGRGRSEELSISPGPPSIIVRDQYGVTPLSVTCIPKRACSRC